jgi:hypothetical protein
MLLCFGESAFGQSIGKDEVEQRLCVGKRAVKVENYQLFHLI